jgi:RHS repeat-associated protein
LRRTTAVGPVASQWLSPSYFNGSVNLSTTAASITAQFRYDFRGRRIARSPGATTPWTYTISDSAGKPLSEMQLVSGTWQKIRDYVWLDGRPIAQVEYPGPSGSTQGYPYYYHLDHIGLPRVLTNSSKQTIWSAQERPYGDVIEKTAKDPLSGKTVVTNLRLPGQYDERLLGSLGLQGPYYNWNRWYLPGVGRYLEPDPIAMVGGMNGPYGPDWYNYANGNPLSYSDPFGLDAAVCTRPFDVKYPPPYAKHCFVEFNDDPGDTVSFDPNGVHPDPAPTKPGTQCKPSPGPQDDDCVKKEMKKCKNYNFFGFNCCDCVAQALKACHVAAPGSWPNWPFNPK